MNPLKALAIDSTPYDAGTLWTMHHSNRRARCALLARSARWELRVIVDGRKFWSQRCPRSADAFELAETWRQRMLKKHWTPIVPCAASDGSETPATSAARRSRGSRRRDDTTT